MLLDLTGVQFRYIFFCPRRAIQLNWSTYTTPYIRYENDKYMIANQSQTMIINNPLNGTVIFKSCDPQS